MSNTDIDGMPLAPNIVLTSPQGAYSVFGPAIEQATSWHPPTQQEKQMTLQLLTNFQLSTINGISKDTTQKIMEAADSLGLQVCRAKTTKIVNSVQVPDSYLLAYTKPGIHNYSGAFFMLRETKHSKVLIISPHDDSDGTYADTKLGMSGSYALACISNGHNRGKATSTDAEYKASDFVHSNNNLGTYAVEQFCKLFPSTVCMHIHGMTNPQKCMFHSRDSVMGSIFQTTLINNTRLTAPEFTGLAVTFSIDNIVNTNRYIKTEMPAVIHENNKSIIKIISIEMEKNLWAW
jgi:hypothetical protein